MAEEDGEEWRRIEEYADALEWGIENEEVVKDEILKAFISMMKRKAEEAKARETAAQVTQ